MMIFRILGDRIEHYDEAPPFPGYDFTIPAEDVRIYRVEVENYGRYPGKRVIEVMAQDENDLAHKLDVGSREDLAAYRVGD